MHMKILIITSFSFSSSTSVHLSSTRHLLLSPLYIYCTLSVYFIYISFCISISTLTLSLSIWYSLIPITAHALLLLCRHFMLWFAALLWMHYRLFQFPDLNSASALSCFHCALTWFKFKLACMSLANQMFCMIIYGWALSEIKGCCPFCLHVEPACADLSVLIRYYSPN